MAAAIAVGTSVSRSGPENETGQPFAAQPGPTAAPGARFRRAEALPVTVYLVASQQHAAEVRGTDAEANATRGAMNLSPLDDLVVVAETDSVADDTIRAIDELNSIRVLLGEDLVRVVDLRGGENPDVLVEGPSCPLPAAATKTFPCSSKARWSPTRAGNRRDPASTRLATVSASGPRSPHASRASAPGREGCNKA